MSFSEVCGPLFLSAACFVASVWCANQMYSIDAKAQSVIKTITFKIHDSICYIDRWLSALMDVNLD